MSSVPDNGKRWIGHYRDHFSKYSILWVQQRKSADETIENMERFVFSYLGVPRILQSDNGRKFDNQVRSYIYKYFNTACIVTPCTFMHFISFLR